MNKLKMSMALITLMIPLLLCAKGRCIKLELVHSNHRTSVESFIPVEAFFDNNNKELTIEFAQDWEPVTIEIRSKEGNIIYMNYFTPTYNTILSIPLKNMTSGTYELVISDAAQSMAGIFIY